MRTTFRRVANGGWRFANPPYGCCHPDRRYEEQYENLGFCEKRIIGAGLEHRLTHKNSGMFAALRLRHGFKSKRPKERPKSLPFTIIGNDGSTRIVEIPAQKVPRYWVTYVTLNSPGVIIGLPRNAPALGRVITQYDPDDIKALTDLLRPGDSIQLTGSGDARDVARMMAKIAHGMTVAEYGLDAFDPWLPNFILGKDDCTLHYYVTAHENNTIETSGDHRVSLGSWGDDPTLIGATVRLFCRYGSPDYEVAVGKSKATHT